MQFNSPNPVPSEHKASMRTLVERFDWSATPLGAMRDWHLGEIMAVL